MVIRCSRITCVALQSFGVVGILVEHPAQDFRVLAHRLQGFGVNEMRLRFIGHRESRRCRVHVVTKTPCEEESWGIYLGPIGLGV